MTPQPVTVLGLGAMGRALAAAFVDAGHSTTVWNRTPGRATGLGGAREARSVRDAVRASSLVVICLLDDDAVTSTVAAAGDALAGRTVVDLTNGTPAQARARATELLALGAAPLDGGILAVPEMIGGPQARILYSGSGEVFEKVRPTLSTLGEPRYLGADPGLAALYDVALLSAMYGLLGGALHAFALVHAAGLEAADLVDLLDPWLHAMLSSLPPTAQEIDRGSSEPASSPLSMQAAAFANLRATARDLAVHERLIDGVGTMIDDAVAAGYGDHDVAVLATMLVTATENEDERRPAGADPE